jgi:hypothetical protein
VDFAFITNIQKLLRREYMNMNNKHKKLYRLLGLAAVIILTLSITYIALALSIGTYDQCANDQGDGYPGSVCKWINGNLQHSNSTYREGDATVQRLWLTDLTPGPHTVTFDYGTTKGGKHAYDFLTSWNWSEDWITEASRCEGIDWCVGLGESMKQIPVDPSANGLDNIADGVQPRVFTMRGGSLDSISEPMIQSGSYTGDSDTRITVSFTVPDSGTNCTMDKKGVTTCDVVLWFGAHVARSDEWDTGGAGDIPGSPYHVSLALVDGDSAGSRDNQMASTAIIQNGTITIVKDAIPNDAQDFSFNLTDGLLYNQNFSLDDDSNATLPNSVSFNVSPGTYTAQELTIPLGWHLTNLVCVDPTSNTTVSLATATATINLASGETVTCTFTDTFQKENPTVVTEIHNASEAVVTSVPLGTTVHDKATVNGVLGFPTPTGTVDFTWFSNGVCEGTGTASGTGIELTSGVAHPSNAQGPLAAGSYSFKAHYNGDTYYNSADSACELLTVNKAPLTVTTAVHDATHDDKTSASVPLGSIMHDTAAVTGGVEGFALPSVSFTFFANGTCEGVGTPYANDTTPSPDTLASIDTAALGAGSYAFQAVVAGDSNYIGDTSDCEPFTVDKAQLEINTEVHNGSHGDETNQTVPLGSVLHDSATVSGGVFGFSLPSVSFTFFGNGDCDGVGTPYNNYTPPAPDQFASVNTAALTAGSYSFQASVAGNDNYLGDISPCEPFMVGKAQLSISTEVHNDDGDVPLVGDLPLGGGAHDSATVEGKVDAYALPDVTFYFFADGETCTNGDTTGGTMLNTLAPDGTTGIAHPSTSQTNLAAGDYNFMAVVAGNDNYEGATSDCEPFSVSKADTTTVTEIHLSDESVASGPIALGSTVHDQATVSGTGAGTPTGSVDFTWYANGICDGGSAAGTVTLASGVAHPSDSEGPLPAGSYSFKAVYSGDDNYNGSTSDCEPLSVSKADTTTVTEIHLSDESVVSGPIALGSTVHDQATVSGTGAGTPTGSVDFTWYANGICDGGSAAGTVTLASGVAHPSDSEGPLPAGSYSFKAVYSGDDNYNGSTSACEPLTVNKASLSISTNIHNANHDVVTSVFEDSIVHDTASVVGGVGSFTLPPVNFTFFTNGTCTGDGTAVANDGKEGILYKSVDSDPLAVGSYSYHAIVDSNSNYTGATSSCEPLTVNPPTAALLPTQTTCQMYRDNLWPPMYDAFTYGVKGGAINSLSPGVIFYYNRITATGTSFTVEETNGLSWPAMLVHSSLNQAILYNLDCEKVAYASSATGTGTIANPYTVYFDGLSLGTEYIIGIKYSPANLVGTSVTSPYPTNTYFWEMDGYPGSAVSIDVKPR